MDNVHKQHRERVREKFLSAGFEGWHDHEVLEMMLFYVIPREDTNPIAHALIEKFGTLAQVLDASVEALLKVKGVGRQTAIYLNALGKMQKNYTRSKWSKNKSVLSNSTVTGLYCTDYIGNETEEVLAVVCLDSQNAVKHKEIISRGTIDRVDVSIRKIAETSFNVNARYIVLCHNHPSGIPHPSQEDIEITDLVVKALKPFDIEVFDHIIVGGESFSSMADIGLLNN